MQIERKEGVFMTKTTEELHYFLQSFVVVEGGNSRKLCLNLLLEREDDILREAANGALQFEELVPNP